MRGRFCVLTTGKIVLDEGFPRWTNPTREQDIRALAVEIATLTTSETFIANPGNVFSEPIMTVYGRGKVTLMVGMTIMELEITDSITLDTLLMEAYSGSTSMNSRMSGDFPTLPPGQNAVSWTGNVSRVVIQPNWRYL